MTLEAKMCSLLRVWQRKKPRLRFADIGQARAGAAWKKDASFNTPRLYEVIWKVVAALLWVLKQQMVPQQRMQLLVPVPRSSHAALEEISLACRQWQWAL
jgi:hypothetical protein